MYLLLSFVVIMKKKIGGNLWECTKLYKVCMVHVIMAALSVLILFIRYFIKSLH